MGPANSDVELVKVLDGQNYKTWSWYMKMYLMQQGLFDVVDGSTTMPDEDKVAAGKWMERDQKALGSIALRVDASQKVHIEDAKTSREAWSALEKVFNRVSLADRVKAIRNFYGIRLEKGAI